MEIEDSIIINNKATITLTIIEAKNLVIADRKKLSNPYLEITLGNQTRRTKILKKTVNPEWNESFTFELEEINQNTNISIKAWSKRRMNKSDYLGELKYFLEGLKKNEEKLVEKDLNTVNSGTIIFSVVSDVSVREFQTKTLSEGKRLEIKIIQVKEMNDACDKYISLQIGNFTYKTKVIRSDDTTTVFNESFDINLPEITQLTILPLTVHSITDFNVSANDYSGGYSLIPLEGSVKNVPNKKWYPIYGIQGQVEIELIPHFDLEFSPLPIIQDRIVSVVSKMADFLNFKNQSRLYVYEESEDKKQRVFRKNNQVLTREHKKRSYVKTKVKNTAGFFWYILTLPYQLTNKNCLQK